MACWAVRAVPTENLVEVRFGGLGQGLITLIPSRQTPLMLPIVWVVDEKARLEASPLYQLSTPERKKALEAPQKSAPATGFVFTDSSFTVVGGDPVAYKILKRTATSLVLVSSASSDGLMPQDEITIEYVNDASLKVTLKSQGITLVLSRVK